MSRKIVIRSIRVLLATACAGSVLSSERTFAKRTPPPDVTAVTADGVRYEAPPFDNPCKQNGGCVVAHDADSNAQLWFAKVYCNKYPSGFENDVEDVFITSFDVMDGHLLVSDEKNRSFSIDLKTHEVTGDDRACGGGCAIAALGREHVVTMIAALLGLVLWRRR